MTGAEKDELAAEFRAFLDRAEGPTPFWLPADAKRLAKFAASSAKRAGSGVSADMAHAIDRFAEATSLVPFVQHALRWAARNMRSSGIAGYADDIEKAADRLAPLIQKRKDQ